MNQDWQEFLAAQGAQLLDGTVQHFGDAATERIATVDGTVLCDLSQFGLLKVSGEDAQSFLQNLLSNDIREVTANHAQLSSFNNAKGRMLASMLIWKNGNDYLLQLPRGLCETLRKKLSMYVLRAKVKISDVSDESICIGISGPDADAMVREHVGPSPDTIMSVIPCAEADGSAHFTLIRLGSHRFQINTTQAHAPALWQKLGVGARPVGSPCWDWLDIRAGIPFVQPATLEAFVPQMLNFEVIGGVNFKKGCYPGQEVVARMHYLGKPKKRMYLAHLAIDVAPKAGDEVFSSDLEGQACGTVVNAVAAPLGGYDLLAVVQTSSRDNLPVHLGMPDGAQLQFQDLPYSLT